ncbi:hypothetical protein Ddye_012571, partial [Dipteronia dyeriana]
GKVHGSGRKWRIRCFLNFWPDSIEIWTTLGGRIIGWRPLSSVYGVFPEGERKTNTTLRLRKEVDQLGLDVHGSEPQSYFLTHGPHGNEFETGQNQQRKRPFCEHCRKPGHKKDICWEIHGNPTD